MFDKSIGGEGSGLLIEHSKVRPLLAEGRAIIITEDLCEILENYGGI